MGRWKAVSQGRGGGVVWKEPMTVFTYIYNIHVERNLNILDYFLESPRKWKLTLS